MYSRLTKILLCASIAVLLPGTAFATNGSLLIGAGPKHRSMGGSGVAMPMEATSQLINPAAVTELGIRADASAMLFAPKRQACTRVVPECAKSGSNLFLLPSMGGAYKFNRRLSLGFAAAGVGGGSTRYSRDIFVTGGPPRTVGADLKQMVMAMSVAYRMNKNLSVGMAPLIGIQSFRAYGLDTFITPGITADPENITNRGNDYSYGMGVRFGALVKFFDGRLNFGASHSSRIYMTKFDKYRGLFTEEGSFDMPEQFTFGLAVKPISKMTVTLDATRVYFSDVPALGNSINNTVGTSTDPSTKGRLGEEDGGGFGWQNQWIYKAGINYDWSDRLSLRIGVNYGKSPVPEDDNLLVNTIAPITTEWHAATGFTYAISKTADLSVGYVHAFKNTLSNFDSGQFPIAPGGGAEISMVQNSLDIGLSKKF